MRSDPEPTAELKAFLEWRRACAAFRREVQAAAPGRSVGDLLRGGATGLARLARRAEQAGLPAGDRVRIEDLRRRIAAWLREDQAGSPGAGRRLWQELGDLTQVLCRTPQRADLREHDRELLGRVRQELARARSNAQALPPVVRVLLDGLFGLDDELDHLLERRRAAPADLEPVLARIEEELAEPGETVH